MMRECLILLLILLYQITIYVLIQFRQFFFSDATWNVVDGPSEKELDL